jgi:hypothetical protein
MDGETKSHNLLNSAFPAIWRGKPSPQAYCVRPYPFQRWTPPQRPRRNSHACRETESACPAARASHRPRLLQTLSGASRQTGPGGGIPARPSFSDQSNCLRDRLVAGPEPHGLPPPIGDPLLGAEVPPRLPWAPRHKALSSPFCPLRRGRVPTGSATSIQNLPNPSSTSKTSLLDQIHPMITGEIKSKVDRIWDTLWSTFSRINLSCS